jgi:pSer/pThr/pTyr-binding forkhead associated (FHA) protein
VHEWEKVKAMKAKVVVQDPRTSETTVVVGELPITIGRAKGATVRLKDTWVSRNHCRIEQDGDKLVVHDLGSKHGTLVNRNPVKDSDLNPNDEIMVGFTSLWASLCTGSSSSPIVAT